MAYAMVDSNGAKMQPIRDKQLAWAFLFIMFMLLGSYLILNLFVGVVVDNFNSVRKSAEGDISLLTPAQQAWIKTQQTVAKFKPKKKMFPPKYRLSCMSWLGKQCFVLVDAHNKRFDWFVMVCITLNTIVMAMSFFGRRLNAMTTAINSALINN